MDEKRLKNGSHPDQTAINDWCLYGPRNDEIEHMVRALTLTHGLRLAEVENAMLEALRVMERSSHEAGRQS